MLDMLYRQWTEPTITVKELKDKMDKKEPFFLLDVREQEEWDTAKIPGATLIPLRELPNRLKEVPKDKPVICQCHKGGRSAQATHFLSQQGYEGVKNLAGGIDAWSREIDPSVPRY